MAEGNFVPFGAFHLSHLAGVVAVWVVILYWARVRLSEDQRRWVVLALVWATLGQEIIDDVVRAYNGYWLLEHSLPLHLCSFGLFASVYALLTRKQLAFELAYFWGIAACTQALLTPDHTRWRMWFFDGAWNFDAFWNFVSHGLIILNVLWLVFVEGMRCRKGSWLRVLLITNLAMIPVAMANLAIGGGANYWFISEKPGGDSPLILGEWPFYILGFEALGIIFFFLLYLPMRGATQSSRVR